MPISVDPDQMPHFAASDLGLLCLLKPVCSNTQGFYDMTVTSLLKTEWEIQYTTATVFEKVKIILNCCFDFGEGRKDSEERFKATNR